MEKAKDVEKYTIKNILHNEYDMNLIRKPPQKRQRQNTLSDSQHQKTKWVTFTYSGKEVR
jgi:hypothetical protein